MVKVAASAAVAADIVRHGPVWAGIFVQQAKCSVLFTRRVEIARRKYIMVVRQGVTQVKEVLVGGDSHRGRMKRCREMHGKSRQQGAVRKFECGLQDATRITHTVRETHDRELV